jgi:hypothetical protein
MLETTISPQNEEKGTPDMRRTITASTLASACRMGRRFTFVALMITLLAFVTSCATVSESLRAGFTTGVTTYGKPPVADPAVSDRYTFKVYYGKLGTRSNADTCATEAIEKFQIASGYSAHKIIEVSKHPFPVSYYIYTVAFSR